MMGVWGGVKVATCTYTMTPTYTMTMLDAACGQSVNYALGAASKGAINSALTKGKDTQGRVNL